MSTPDKPDSPPPLTRRQLREMRNTASTPIITERTEIPTPSAPLPRPAEPAVITEAPVAEEVDLDSPALTRRGARRQERLRTASLEVIDTVPAGDAEADAAEADEPETDEPETDEPETDEPETDAVETNAAEADEVDAVLEIVDEVPADDVEDAEADAAASDADALDEDVPAADAVEVEAVQGDAVEGDALDEDADDEDDEELSADEAPHPVVAANLGSGLLGGGAIDIQTPPSFDQLLGRSTATGALSAPNALILSQTPDTGSLVSPITATGEVLITGTFSLPESFGSTGTVPGSADGKETDAVLIDGELPASSSPTPIAASAAVSTIKSAEDIIRPPAPEKGNKLMMALVITAGALALALTGVLIVALASGRF